MREGYIFISHWKEIFHMRTHYYQFISPSHLRSLYIRPLTLCMIFFPIYQKFGHQKVYQNYRASCSFIAYAAPIQQKNSRLRFNKKYMFKFKGHLSKFMAQNFSCFIEATVFRSFIVLFYTFSFA